MLRSGDTPIREAISGAKSAPQAVRGDTSNRNEKSDILALCLLVGGVLFRPLAIRHGVSPGHRGCDTPGSQKAPSAIRCIKTQHHHAALLEGHVGQKAPSAIRCIKTVFQPRAYQKRVLGQKAPSAIRCIKTIDDGAGAVVEVGGSESTERHKVH